MNKLRKIQMDCHRATYLIEKRAETPLGFSERMQLFIHLLGCSVCRLYRQQSAAIGVALKELLGRSVGEDGLGAGRRAGPEDGMGSGPGLGLDRGLDAESKRTMQEMIDERMRG